MARSKLATAGLKTRKKTATGSVRTAKKAKTAKTAKTGTSKSARKPDAKHIGDVLGLSTARVPKSTPRATTARGGNPKGIEIGPQAKGPAHLKRARVRY